MNTVVVYLLILVIGEGNHAGGPIVVDNIASRQNCEAIASVLQKDFAGSYSSVSRWECIPVRKVVAK